jgi:hypothetical protein
MVKHRHFRFMRSKQSVDELAHALSRLGLVCTPDEDRIVCNRRSAAPIEIGWEVSWQCDGEHEEDGRITVVCDGRVRADIDVQMLLSQRHTQPLRAVIIDRIVSTCDEVIRSNG